MIVNFGQNNDRDVRQEKDRLTTFLREVQNNALAGERASISVSGKVCGFGFRKIGNNIESFYVSTDDLDADCANWKEGSIFTRTSYETLYPQKGVSFTLTGSVFFLSPNAVVDCEGCTLPVSVTITKGSLSASATVDAAGRIY